MAYNLTAQLNLQAPSQSSLKSIRSKIERGLRGIPLDIDTRSVAKAKKQIDEITKKSTRIKIDVEDKNLKSVRKEVDKTTKSLEKGQRQAKSFADAVALKAINYAPYAVASAAIIKITGALASGTREAIKFEQEIAKIAQVTDKSVDFILRQSDAISNLSKEYNLALTKVAQITRTFTQTGLSFREAAKAAEAISKTSLLATFESVDSTTEGLIATMNTFNLSVREGEKSLNAINVVSKAFAIEAGDIVEAVRRAGGAYSAAGGSIEEFIAQLTAVRSTSRESAETIATGFRTIFGRLQRPKTIQYFKELGIELTNLNGQVVKPIEAIDRIKKGLDKLGISAGDVRFAQVVEQIGGIRQLSKVVPLLQETGKAQEAYNRIQQAGIETDKDVAKAQQTLGYRFGQLQKNFQSLISEVVQTDSFKALANTFIDMANGLLSILRAIKPLIPLLTVLATIKIGKGILGAIGTLSKRGASSTGSGSGGGILGLASGGFVPGGGNRDTVPALLTPGEFVVNKKSAQAVGYSQLNRINKYAKGGIVQRYQDGEKAEPTKVVGSLENAFSILTKVAETMGEEGNKLLRALTVLQTSDSSYRGKYSPKENTISINPERATGRTVAEEAFHALDVQKGGGKYASQQEGTFENKLAEIAKKTIQYKLEQLADEGRISKETLQYLSDNREAYAKLAKNSNDTIKSIIASQGTVEEKMLSLAKALEDPKNNPSGLFSGIGINIAREAGYKPSAPEGVLSQPKEPRLLSLIDEQRKKDEKVDLLSSIDFESFLEKAAKSGVGKVDLVKIIKTQVEAGKKVDLEAIIKEQTEARNNFDLFSKIKEEADKTKGKIKKFSSALSSAASIGVKRVSEWTDKLDSTKLALFNTALVTAGATLKNFAGISVNQEALTPALLRGQAIGEAGSGVKSLLSRKNFTGGGKAISNFGKSLSDKFPKLGKSISSLGRNIALSSGQLVKFGALIGKASNIIGIVEGLGGLADALYSTNYAKEVDNYVKSGNAAAAAASAQKQYAQELNRTIPIIGGFLNALSFDLSDLIGSKEQKEAFKQTAELNASVTKIINKLNDTQSNFDRSLQTGVGRKAAVEQRGQAFSDRLKNFDELAKNINKSKSLSSKNSLGVNSIIGDVAANAAGGFAAGSSTALINPALGLGLGTTGAIVGGVRGYQSNKQRRNIANKSTDAAVSGLETFSSELERVTLDAQTVADAAARRTFEFGGSLTQAIKNITDNLGGNQEFEQIYGFDPNTIKSTKDYKQALEKAKKTRDSATESINRNNNIVEEGVSLTKGRTLADVNAAKIAAKQAEISKQRAEAAIQVLSSVESLQIQENILNAERQRSIAINKQLLAATKEENRLKDETRNFEKRSTLREEKLTQAQTGIRGGLSRRNDFGVGQVTNDFESTLRSKQGTNQLLRVAQNLSPRLGNQLSQANNLDKALRTLQETKDTGFFGNEVEIGEALKNLQVDPKIADDIAASISKVEGGDIKAIDQIRQNKVNEIGAGAFDAVAERLNSIFDKEQELQERKLNYEKNLFDVRTKYADIASNRQIDAINTFSQFEKTRRGLKQGAESRLSNIRQTRIQKSTQDLNLAKASGSPELEAQARQRLIDAHEAEVDSIKNKINADAEYQKTVLQARSDLIKDYGFGSDSERRGLRFSAGFATVAGQQNSLDNIPKEQRQNVRSFFERFGDVELKQFGNRTGNEVAADISANELIKDIRLAGGNVDAETAKKIKETARQKLKPPEQVLREEFTKQQNEISKLYKEQYDQDKQLLDVEKQIFQNLATDLQNLFKQAGLVNPTNKGFASNQNNQIPQNTNAPNVQVDIQGQQEVVVRLVSNGDVSAAAEKKAYEAISERFNNLADRIQVTAPELAESFRREGIA